MADAEIAQGYPDGTYHPDEPVNRAQMAVFVARAVAGGDAAIPVPPEEPTFPDVPRFSTWGWCYPHVEYLAALTVGYDHPTYLHHVVEGYPDGLYHPERICTRDQIVVYVSRAFERPTLRAPTPSPTRQCSRRF